MLNVGWSIKIFGLFDVRWSMEIFGNNLLDLSVPTGAVCYGGFVRSECVDIEFGNLLLIN